MRRPVLLTCLALATAGLLAGCGDRTSIRNGGRVAGKTLTVYSLLPRAGPQAGRAADVVRGEKLALQQVGAQVGDLTINYVALDLPAGRGRRAQAEAVREAMHDPSIAAVIGDLSDATARVSVPLFNEAGILHVSPGATSSVFTSRPRWRPSGRRSFAPFLAPESEQAAEFVRAARRHGPLAVEATAGAPEQALAGEVRARAGRTVDTARAGTVAVIAGDAQDALGIVEGVLRENRRARVLLPQWLWATGLPDELAGRSRVSFITSAGPATAKLGGLFQTAFGRAPGPYAQIGYDAMNRVLAAIRRAGDRAQSREALIEAYFAADPLAAAARRPWWLARRSGGGTVYEPG